MRARGFTLIELMVVLAVLAVLATLVAPRYVAQSDRARESVLRNNLNETRKAIDDFAADHGRYPSSLQELVDRRYLRSMPTDPITERHDSWTVVAGTGGGVANIRSSAEGRARDGTPYAQW